jgi:hypothetical protein
MAQPEVSIIVHFDGEPTGKWIALCGVDLLVTKHWVSSVDQAHVTCNDCKVILEKK